MIELNSPGHPEKHSMTKKSVPASVNETAFDCPHCGAYTTQFWFSLHARQLREDQPTPTIPTPQRSKEALNSSDHTAEERDKLREWIRLMDTRRVWMDTNPHDGGYGLTAQNLHLSKCYACKKFSVWVHSRLVDPLALPTVQPNPDLPDDIAADFNEARSIVDQSPRGAAALLRLCVQKLCMHLGEKGKNIDDDIASLVKKGLAPVVQQSLDVVRVIGNEAVHPGTMDLSDDPDAANSLFGLVNAIAEQMITHPKHVQALYDKLPSSKRNAIAKRDGKPNGGGDPPTLPASG